MVNKEIKYNLISAWYWCDIILGNYQMKWFQTLSKYIYFLNFDIFLNEILSSFII